MKCKNPDMEMCECGHMKGYHNAIPYTRGAWICVGVAPDNVVYEKGCACKGFKKASRGEQVSEKNERKKSPIQANTFSTSSTLPRNPESLKKKAKR
jgi:hypothetical protein